MLGQDLLNAITEVELLLNGASAIAEEVLPTEEAPIELVTAFANYFLKIVSVGIAGYEGAANVEINEQTILALKADRTPLVPPTQ